MTQHDNYERVSMYFRPWPWKKWNSFLIKITKKEDTTMWITFTRKHLDDPQDRWKNIMCNDWTQKWNCFIGYAVT